MSLDSTFFRVEIDAHVAHLVMNRPEKANAMGPDFWEDLPRLTRTLCTDPEVRAILISGEGKHFSSGMDLTAFAGIADMTKGEPGRAAHALYQHILHLQDSFTALERAHVPVICAIHGACVGGAIDMITAADIRLASEDAYFAVEEINIGMAADVGTLQRLPKVIAPGIAKELCFTGRRFGAAEAKGFGLINKVHPDRDAVVAAGLALARDIAAKSPLAMAGIKRSLNYAVDHPTGDALEQIAMWNAGMLRPEDLMTAMQARAAKQEAEFKGLKVG
ncbi:MAG: crotonase/enoyl-CoA hydratase family protein [Pseudomonadota bacterium]